MLEAVKKIHSNLGKILEVSGMDFSDVSKICEEDVSSNKDFSKLGMEKVDQFLSHLNLSFNHLFKGDFCEQTLEKQSRGYRDVIPYCNLGNKGSSVTSLNNALSHYSLIDRKMFLRRRQISESYLKNKENKVSISVFGDSLSGPKNGNSSVNAFHIGQTNALKHVDTICNIIGSKSSSVDLYKSMFESTYLIESNMKYVVDKTVGSNTLIVKSIPNKECYEIMKESKQDKVSIARNIQGFISGFSIAAPGSRVNVSTLSCNLKGNLFEVVID